MTTRAFIPSAGRHSERLRPERWSYASVDLRAFLVSDRLKIVERICRAKCDISDVSHGFLNTRLLFQTDGAIFYVFSGKRTDVLQ